MRIISQKIGGRVVNIRGLSINLNLLLALLLLVLNSQVEAELYVVSAQINAGTCNVDVTPASPTMPGVDPDKLSGGGLFNTTKIDIKLTCQGSADSEKMPTVNLQNAITVNPALNKFGSYLFTNADSEVKYKGFVLSKTNDASWNTNNFYKVDSVILQGNKGDDFAGKTVSVYVSVGCGDAAECKNIVDNQPSDIGLLKASMQFTFSYK